MQQRQLRRQLNSYGIAPAHKSRSHHRPAFVCARHRTHLSGRYCNARTPQPTGRISPPQCSSRRLTNRKTVRLTFCSAPAFTPDAFHRPHRPAVPVPAATGPHAPAHHEYAAPARTAHPPQPEPRHAPRQPLFCRQP